ncbi:putative aldo-keto reductase [Aspergillus eucalypticola CBS 122712]|uniref:Aldo-keto reductase n=1 Tax=Aspergillus eucalypticola (strain CBS 122712 / IBT 29274) TaxID=1448314 RepID=A0A317WEB1_ASPEC|nr:putative aldo-keto reductase [Aspergillus eucalypticola CBS 122712]PWY82560.1 putative aldo-keto reductase [Aspergillus eucalypticola CBS 122712]
MSLPTSPLGRDGPEVTRIGFGLMGLSSYYGVPLAHERGLDLLDQAYALGERFWDTADVYGDNEDLLGKWFKANQDKRNGVFLATKLGVRAKPDGTIGADSSYEYCLAACERSLKRLGLSTMPVEETIRAMVQLKEQGKIRYLGLSDCSAESLRRAHKIHPISAVQVEYTPFSLDVESLQIRLLETCRELGVALVAGFRTMLPRFTKENLPKTLKLVDKITALAKDKNVTTSQLSLAWLLAQGPDVFPIPGTTKMERLKESLGALSVQMFVVDDARFRRAVNDADIQGDRYPEAFSSTLFVDTPPLNS